MLLLARRNSTNFKIIFRNSSMHVIPAYTSTYMNVEYIDQHNNFILDVIIDTLTE